MKWDAAAISGFVRPGGECPCCEEHKKDGECSACELFLCAYCERWVSWKDGGCGEGEGLDQIDDTICSACYCRRHGLEVKEPVKSVLLEVRQ